ncbi:SCO4848 family membrane protein [Curtobacterium sp. NPDC090217]|uniref:SCO4848 family membrane protein n=1 Tax=unclassified Curtobacterium TaxID=257496 RepID=UPI0038154609
MLVFAAIVLFVGALFNLIAWPRFFQRVAKDTRARDASGRPTTFYTVHLVLLLVALAITAASIVAGILLLV